MHKKKNPAAVELGKLGGRVRVPKGLAKLPSERRSEIAKMGAKARWKRKRTRRGKEKS